MISSFQKPFLSVCWRQFQILMHYLTGWIMFESTKGHFINIEVKNVSIYKHLAYRFISTLWDCYDFIYQIEIDLLHGSQRMRCYILQFIRIHTVIHKLVLISFIFSFYRLLKVEVNYGTDKLIHVLWFISERSLSRKLDDKKTERKGSEVTKLTIKEIESEWSMHLKVTIPYVRKSFSFSLCFVFFMISGS